MNIEGKKISKCFESLNLFKDIIFTKAAFYVSDRARVSITHKTTNVYEEKTKNT